MYRVNHSWYVYTSTRRYILKMLTYRLVYVYQMDFETTRIRIGQRNVCAVQSGSSLTPSAAMTIIIRLILDIMYFTISTVSKYGLIFPSNTYSEQIGVIQTPSTPFIGNPDICFRMQNSHSNLL